MIKALALLSGGLDSTLAIKVVQEQGVDITALHFSTPLCQCDNHKAGCKSNASQVAEQFNIPIKNINNTQEFLKIIENPQHGYGKNMNPCIDCRILMLKTARKHMDELKASFVITGEVLGQRPMSQHRRAMDLIEKESGLTGLILRPLSAQWLDPTIPEQKGWVDRSKLLGIQGRSRKEQMNLAKLFDIKDYPCPAGGCLLTDPGFSIRMKDLLKNSKLALNDILLLKTGRHFRLDDRTKLVVGRNEQDNKIILSLSKNEDAIINMTACPGPVGLLRGNTNQENIDLASRITARYADHSGNPVTAELKVNDQIKTITAEPLDDKKVRSYLIGGN